LVAVDIDAAWAGLAARGVEVSEVFHDASECSTTPGLRPE
jgi:hypothetical protein